jgi:hypothetical protein
MKDLFTPRMIAYYLLVLALALTGDLRAQWTPMHQAALEITESYVDIVPKARMVQPNPVRSVRPVPMYAPINSNPSDVVEVFTLDQFGNVQSSQIIINGSSLIPSQAGNRRPQGNVRTPR